MKTSLLLLATGVSIALTTSGCVTSRGPLYSAVKQSRDLAIQERTSLILIYWMDGMGGVRVYANEQMIAKIGPGQKGFISYQAEPGEIRLSSGIGTGNIPGDVFRWGILQAATGQKGDRIAFHAVPGRMYYVRLQRGFSHETMQLVSEGVAAREIANCHWQNAPAPYTQTDSLR